MKRTLEGGLHAAIIMDTENGRWANARGLPRALPATARGPMPCGE